MTDIVPCPDCGSPAEWCQRALRYVMRCTRCGLVFDPPRRAEVQRAVDDCRRAVAGRAWSAVGGDDAVDGVTDVTP